MKQKGLWIPNGKLSDGTMLLGPAREAPACCQFTRSLTIDGKVWHIGLSKGDLGPDQISELEVWARAQLAIRAKKVAELKR